MDQANHLEDTTGTKREDYVEMQVLYYNMYQYYLDNGWPEQTPHNQRNVCFNSDFDYNELSDDLLDGFLMYDGTSPHATNILNCRSNFMWLPLPLESRPTFAENRFPDYRFNLDHNDKGPINSTQTYFDYSNFNSFELFDGGVEARLGALINRTPPSGNKSIKINNDHVRYHVNRLSKTFDVDVSTYYYNFASVMQNPDSHDNEQPYFTVQLTRLSDNQLLSSRCYVSDTNDPFLIGSKEL